jgi:hypothetical protein
MTNPEAFEDLTGSLLEESKTDEPAVVNYYNSLPLDRQIEIGQDEGLYMPGVDIVSTLNLILEQLGLGQEAVSALTAGKSIEQLTGESVDIDFDERIKELGYRNEKNPHKKIKPESVLSDTSSLNNIIREGKKFSDDDEVHIDDLRELARMLYKYKTDEAQWVRVASLVETIYQYYGTSLVRDDFFSSNKILGYQQIKNIEEFWKTDFIFMSQRQRTDFMKSLAYYGEPVESHS